jgi:hypothetical protein
MGSDKNAGMIRPRLVADVDYIAHARDSKWVLSKERPEGESVTESGVTQIPLH